MNVRQHTSGWKRSAVIETASQRTSDINIRIVHDEYVHFELNFWTPDARPTVRTAVVALKPRTDALVVKNVTTGERTHRTSGCFFKTHRAILCVNVAHCESVASLVLAHATFRSFVRTSARTHFYLYTKNNLSTTETHFFVQILF